MPSLQHTRQQARPGLRVAVGVAAMAMAVAVLLVTSPVTATESHSQQQQPLFHGLASPLTDEAFCAFVSDTLSAWHVPGVAIAMVDGDATWSEGFGLAVLQPPTPVTRDTLFYTASTTKAFVAAVLSLLVAKEDDAGDVYDAAPEYAPPIRINWTTPLAAVLGDDFVVAGDPWATAHLTIEDALCHRTGLASHDLSRSRQYGLFQGGNATVRDVTRSLRYLPLSSSPRTAWRYCNLMFLVLSHAVETLAGGRWLGSVLHTWLWAPLGMQATFLSLDDARAAAPPTFLAQGYYWKAAEKGAADGNNEGYREYVAVPHMPLDEVSGAGGIISTVADYAKWLRCWIDGPHASTSASTSATACGGIPFSKTGIDAILAPKMFQAHSAASPEPYDAPMAYASAWMTSSYKGHRFWGHSGGSNAFGAQIYFFPDDRFGVVLFGNTAITSNAAELILLWHLVDERFGIPTDQRYDWDTRFRNAAALRKARVNSALDRLFPDRADPPLPPALPIDAYVGTYHHPAYQNMTLRVVAAEEEEKGLAPPKGARVIFVADRYAHTWPTRCEFVHVSGEWWLLYTDMLYERSGHFRSYGRARFHIGADARPHTLQVEFWDAGDDTVEGVFLFERLE